VAALDRLEDRFLPLRQRHLEADIDVVADVIILGERTAAKLEGGAAEPAGEVPAGAKQAAATVWSSARTPPPVPKPVETKARPNRTERTSVRGRQPARPPPGRSATR
jgi:hypothetical protein